MLRRSTVFSISVLVLILIIGGISATKIDVFAKREKQMAPQTEAQTATSAAFNLPTSIQSISISDDSRAGIFWIPHSQKAVSSQVISWLKKAIPYTRKVPQSQDVGTSNANIGPAILHIMTSDKHEIMIYPAYYIEKSERIDTSISENKPEIVSPLFITQYVQDVIVFNNGGNISYLKSEELYNWLKEDHWKTEFKRR